MRITNALAALLLLAALILPGCPVSKRDTPDGNDPHPAVTSIEDVSDADLADFYAAFADVLERDSSIVATTGQFRTAYMRAGQLAFQRTNMHGRHPDLANKIDHIMAEWIGLDDVPLTDQKRSEVVACLRAIAQALR